VAFIESLVFVVLPVCVEASEQVGLLSSASCDMIEKKWQRYASRFQTEVVQRKKCLEFEM